MTIHPFGDRIAVVDPPAADSERESGIILPPDVAMVQMQVGIIVSTGNIEDSEDDPDIRMVMGYVGQSLGIKPQLKKGMLIYYRKGVGCPIGDVIIVDLRDVVAFEDA